MLRSFFVFWNVFYSYLTDSSFCCRSVTEGLGVKEYTLQVVRSSRTGQEFWRQGTLHFPYIKPAKLSLKTGLCIQILSFSLDLGNGTKTISQACNISDLKLVNFLIDPFFHLSTKLILFLSKLAFKCTSSLNESEVLIQSLIYNLKLG